MGTVYMVRYGADRPEGSYSIDEAWRIAEEYNSQPPVMGTYGPIPGPTAVVVDRDWYHVDRSGQRKLHRNQPEAPADCGCDAVVLDSGLCGACGATVVTR